jgi:hypothetical protein
VNFLLASLATYAALTVWITQRAQGTMEEWAYTAAHLALAALINTHLLWVARKRSLSFLGSAPLAFLVVLHFYFTINGIKYFSPILLYPQFEITLGQQFAGCAAAAVVLFLCARVLLSAHGPTTEVMQDWVRRYWPDVRRIVLVTAVASIGCKVMLTKLGYGSSYTDSTYTEHAVRSYSDYLLLLGNDAFGSLSLVFGLIYLTHPRLGRSRPGTAALAVAAVLLQVGYTLLFIKARMILLTGLITYALASELISRRRAERVLQLLLVSLPVLSLLGVQLTLLIGRFNVPEDAGLRIGIGAINRRAELTDFASAMVVDSKGDIGNPEIISAAILNSIPRAVFPGKDRIVRDVYSEILEQKLGWQAGEGEDLLVDYLDTPFSNGVMSFGPVGFVLIPIGLVWLFAAATRWTARSFHGFAFGLSLIALALVATHVEGEWSSIPLNFRQAVFFVVLALVSAWSARRFSRFLVVATHPPTMHGGPAPGALVK